MAIITQYFKLIRISHWIKNIFIFLPLFFGLKLLEPALLARSFYAFFAFCLMTSCVYIMNDIVDIKHDQKHPKKKHRPIASGKISIQHSIITASLLFGLSIIGTIKISLPCLLILLTYFLLNLAYTFKLKHIAIIDIFCIAIGFLLRLYIGSIVTGVLLSKWIIVLTFFLAIFLGLAKRRGELLLAIQGYDARKAIEGYNLKLIDTSLSIVASIIIVAYLMYSLSPDVTLYFSNNNIYITSIFVLCGIMRYLQLTFVFNRTENPTKVVLTDYFLQLILLGWALMFIIIIYKLV